MTVNFLHSGMTCTVAVYLFAFPVIYSLKLLTAAYRPVYRAGSYTEHFLYIVNQFKRIFCLSVKLINKGKYRYIPHNTNLKKLLGLCLYTLACIYYHYCRVGCHKCSVGIFREVLMPRSIKYIYTKIIIIKLHYR